MGINFVAAHPADVFVEPEGRSWAEALAARFAGVPLGREGEAFVLEDEMGWSWWQELQDAAVETLGEDHVPQVLATDAWHAVYLDVDGLVREVLRRPQDTRDPSAPWTAPKPPWWRVLVDRMRGRQPQVPPDVQAVMDAMVERLATRRGERGGLQVGNLRALLVEIEAFLGANGIDPVNGGAAAALEFYREGDRADDDVAIQCACHAWITGRNALEAGAPLWLVK